MPVLDGAAAAAAPPYWTELQHNVCGMAFGQPAVRVVTGRVDPVQISPVVYGQRLLACSLRDKIQKFGLDAKNEAVDPKAYPSLIGALRSQLARAGRGRSPRGQRICHPIEQEIRNAWKGFPDSAMQSATVIGADGYEEAKKAREQAAFLPSRPEEIPRVEGRYSEIAYFLSQSGYEANNPKELCINTLPGYVCQVIECPIWGDRYLQLVKFVLCSMTRIDREETKMVLTECVDLCHYCYTEPWALSDNQAYFMGIGLFSNFAVEYVRGLFYHFGIQSYGAYAFGCPEGRERHEIRAYGALRHAFLPMLAQYVGSGIALKDVFGFDLTNPHGDRLYLNLLLLDLYDTDRHMLQIWRDLCTGFPRGCSLSMFCQRNLRCLPVLRSIKIQSCYPTFVQIWKNTWSENPMGAMDSWLADSLKFLLGLIGDAERLTPAIARPPVVTTGQVKDG